MSDTHRNGTEVKWKWGSGYGHGKVTDIFTQKVTRTLEGAEVTRNATSDQPAYMIEQDDGVQVLKSHSEVEKK